MKKALFIILTAFAVIISAGVSYQRSAFAKDCVYENNNNFSVSTFALTDENIDYSRAIGVNTNGCVADSERLCAADVNRSCFITNSEHSVVISGNKSGFVMGQADFYTEGIFYGEDEVISTFNDETVSASPTIIDKIGDVIFGNKTQSLEKVYLGGTPLGISLDSKGVRVIGISEINSDNGMKCPAIGADIRIGDLIVKINGQDVTNSMQLSQAAAESEGKSVEITVERNGQSITKSITPEYDILQKRFKLGLWTKEGSSGIGTLTFVKKNGDFASLGHPIVSSETGEICAISGGSVYRCEITGVIKNTRGKAGELKGNFLDKKIGTVNKNTKLGVYGSFSEKDFYSNYEEIDVLPAKGVKPGKAYVYSTVEGDKPTLYEAEIIKAANQTSGSDKGIVIRITDARLIEKTAGIVQGMSGSPIIQDGALVGAITHVFINDGIKGYGVYAEYMLDMMG